jgi:hypothetical protein
MEYLLIHIPMHIWLEGDAFFCQSSANAWKTVEIDLIEGWEGENPLHLLWNLTSALLELNPGICNKNGAHGASQNATTLTRLFNLVFAI